MEHIKTSIFTLNLYGVPFSQLTRRLQYITDEIHRVDAEVLTFQQVHTFDVVWHLKHILPEFRYICYEKGVIGPVAGLVTFAKYPLTRKEFTPVNDARLGIFKKGILICSLKNQTIVNVHLSANTLGDWTNQSVFYAQHQKELSILSQVISKHEIPIIIAGDFNIPRDCTLFESFLSDNQLYDALKNDIQPTFRKEFLPIGEPGRRIDHILIKGRVYQTSYSYICTDALPSKGVRALFPSDHVGLYSSNDIALP